MIALVFFSALVTLAASIGAYFEPGEWYNLLTKPRWTPPNWLFGPVWTTLYIMICLAGWQAWQKDYRLSPPVILWGAQLFLNAAWSGLFFGMHRPGLALICILLLLGCIIGFIQSTYQNNKRAALLFIPYLIWILFATALNFQIWRLNP